MTSQNIHLSSKSTIPQFVLQLYEVFTNKNGSFRSHHLSRSHWPTMIYTYMPFVSSEICVCCSDYSRKTLNFESCSALLIFFWPIYSAISWTPYLSEIWPVLSLICRKNCSAYRQINTVSWTFDLHRATRQHTSEKTEGWIGLLTDIIFWSSDIEKKITKQMYICTMLPFIRSMITLINNYYANYLSGAWISSFDPCKSRGRILTFYSKI